MYKFLCIKLLIFSYPYRSVITYVLGALKDCLIETVLSDSSFECPEHMFWLKNKKTFFLVHTLIKIHF